MSKPTVPSGLALASVIVIVMIPAGKNDAYPLKPLKETVFAEACRALPAAALQSRTGRQTSGTEVTEAKVRAEVENLFPSIARTACEYSWQTTCRDPMALQRAVLEVVAMPDATQALNRYTYNRELLHQDSLKTNAFRSLLVDRHIAYEFVIEDEILVRMLDRHDVLDLHAHLCSRHPDGRLAERVIEPLLRPLQFPRCNDKPLTNATESRRKLTDFGRVE